MTPKEYFNVDHSLYDLYDPKFLAYPLQEVSTVPQELYVRLFKLALRTDPDYAQRLFLVMQKHVDDRNETIKAKNQKIIDLSRELSALKRKNKK